jgi:chromate transporter
VGLNSFGGPAGQIAVIHREIVERRRWLGERRFLHALNYCMLLPGPEAQQLATYVGWLLHGVRGGLAAGLLFIAPGVVAIMALSTLYAGFHDTSGVQALFYGIKPAVIAVVLLAVLRLGRRTLATRLDVGLAGAAFVALFFFDVAFPLVIGAAALTALVAARSAGAGLQPAVEEGSDADESFSEQRPSTRRALAVLLVGLPAWLLPTVALVALLGPRHVLAREAAFFSTAAVVTFGGAYAVLAFIAQQAVGVFGWLTPSEMVDGLGMAETTPGPLIMVVQFVGFMGAFRNPTGLDPFAAGALGGLLVTWVTFTPSFLWIFLGAPYAEYLRRRRALSAALRGITAAVVGVILNLAVWFSLQTLFGVTGELRLGPARIHTFELTSLDPAGLALAALALALLGRWRWSMLLTIAVCAGLGFVYYLLAAS